MEENCGHNSVRLSANSLPVQTPLQGSPKELRKKSVWSSRKSSIFPQNNPVLAYLRSSKKKRSQFQWFHKNKFYASTPIGGLNVIDTAKYGWETVIWYIILIVFACLTVKNANDVVREFIDEPTITTTKIIEIDQESISLPDFHMSLYIPQEILMSDFLEKLSPQEFEAYDGPYAKWSKTQKNRFIGHLRVSLMKLFNNSKEEFLTKRWKPTFVRDCLLMLNGIHTVRGAAILIGKKLRSLKVNSNEFYSKLEQEVVSMLGLSIEDKDEKNVNYSMRIWPTYQPSFGSILTTFSFHLRQNTLLIVVAVNKVINSTIYQQPRAWLKDGDTYNITDRAVADLSLSDLSLRLNLYVGKFLRTDIRRTGTFSSQLENCHSFINPDQCINQCLITVFNQSCNCSPYRFALQAWNTSHDSICSITDEHKIMNIHDQHQSNISKVPGYPCKWKISSDLIKSKCHNSCKPFHPCERVFYDSSTLGMVDIGENDTEFIKVRLQTYDKNTFIAFTEDYRTTWSQFAAELGGVLDLWIGASVAGFVHLSIYLVKQFAYSCDKQTKTGITLRSMLDHFNPSAVAGPAALSTETGTDKSKDIEKSKGNPPLTKSDRKKSTIDFICQIRRDASQKIKPEPEEKRLRIEAKIITEIENLNEKIERQEKLIETLHQYIKEERITKDETKSEITKLFQLVETLNEKLEIHESKFRKAKLGFRKSF